MDEIRELQGRWMRAWLDRDRDTVEAILHPQFTLRSSASDAVVDRASWIESVLSGRVAGTAFTYDEMTVTVSGDTAIVDNRATFTGTIDGRDWSRTTYQTDVWVREDGPWRVIRRHSSLPVGNEGGMQA